MGEQDISQGAAESIIKLFSAIDLCAHRTKPTQPRATSAQKYLNWLWSNRNVLLEESRADRVVWLGVQTALRGRGYLPLESCFTAVRLRVITINIPALEQRYMITIICKRTFFFGADYSCILFMCYLLLTPHYALFTLVVKF